MKDRGFRVLSIGLLGLMLCLGACSFEKQETAGDAPAVQPSGTVAENAAAKQPVAEAPAPAAEAEEAAPKPAE